MANTVRFATPLSGLEPVVQKHLRKVYHELFFACLAASVGAGVQLYTGFFNQLLSSVLIFGSLMYFMSLAPHHPRRRQAFLTIAFAKGMAIGPLLALAFRVNPVIPMMACLGTTTIFASLSISALFSRRKTYLYLGGFLSSAVSMLALFSLIGLFVPKVQESDVLMGLQLYGGLLVFSGYVLYDTSLIIEKAHAGERDSLKHALDLFINMMAIFVRVIIILIRNKESREREERRKKRGD